MPINSSHLLDLGALGGGLGHRGILGDLYFQKWAPRLDGSTIFETCPSKEREARAVKNHEDIRR